MKSTNQNNPMNNNLTERELACYVGTGVKVRILQNGKLRTDRELDGALLDAIIWNQTKQRFPELTHKLILRPPSDLTKPCLEGGKVPIEVLFELCTKLQNKEFSHIDIKETFIEIYNLESGDFMKIFTDRVTINSYDVVNWLHENHFDTQNLIGRKLAIDVNTIEAI